MFNFILFLLMILSSSQIKHVLAPNLLSLCYERIGSCFKLCVYGVINEIELKSCNIAWKIDKI